MASVTLKVQLTRVFREALLAIGEDPEFFAGTFADWRRNWPRWEDKDWSFGKDNAYRALQPGKNNVLRHVHMPPNDPATWPQPSGYTPEEETKIKAEFANWEKHWDLEDKSCAQNRVSSRVLVYVDGGRHGFLLMHLGFEPDGHDDITNDKATMKSWAEVAERFQYNGDIII